MPRPTWQRFGYPLGYGYTTDMVENIEFKLVNYGELWRMVELGSVHWAHTWEDFIEYGSHNHDSAMMLFQIQRHNFA